MDKTMITAPSAPPAGPYSPGLAVGEWVFLAGQTGAGDTIEEQTEQALDKVVALLEQAGCTVADVVSCLVHLADLSTFQRYNVVYERYFPRAAAGPDDRGRLPAGRGDGRGYGGRAAPGVTHWLPLRRT